MPRFFGIPFGTSGDRATVPDPAQGDGSVSFTEGYTFDYERPNTDPNYKPIGRQEWNGIMHDVTEAVGDIQKQGAADWMAEAAPYAINARVRHAGQNWISLVENNSATPAAGASWRVVDGLSSTTQAGEIRIATEAETDGAAQGLSVSPFFLKMGYSATFGTTGFIKLPSWMGGFTMQWSSINANVASGVPITWTFPIAFSNACFITLATHSNSAAQDQKVMINMFTPSTTSVGYNLSSGGAQIARLFALGR